MNNSVFGLTTVYISHKTVLKLKDNSFKVNVVSFRLNIQTLTIFNQIIIAILIL